MNISDPDFLETFMKGLNNAAARAHGGAVPFPDLELSPDMKQRVASAYEHGEALAAEIAPIPLDFLKRPLDKQQDER